ncbi:MAG: lytic transglycosylase domain-containing protein, partial [Bdellovibrionales bacterium]|nr:lytic transglycosylase domain-containing protein [Bdellovibrionales bacterium]
AVEVGTVTIDALKEPAESREVHEIYDHYANPDFTKRDVLTDKFDRIPDVLKVPDSLYSRVSFWFDVYTKYSSHYEIIHHRDYPWIVLEVLDLRKFYEGNDHKWTKYHRARKYVSQEKAKIRNTLRRLARLRSFSRVSEDEQRYIDMISAIPGRSIKSKLLSTANRLRTQLGQKDFHKSGLANSSQYLPQMEQIFAQYDLPVELTRLPLVESSFNEKAVSKVGASGVWQFMPSIGKKYLKVGERIDERNSPVKATGAAAQLMLENFRIMKSWPLAVTAYNHGPGGVKLASRKARSTDLATMIEKYDSARFGFASKNFFACFLAALHSERYQEELFGDIPRKEPLQFEDVRLTRNVRVHTVAEVLGLTLEEVKLYNQDLKARSIQTNVYLPVGYNLHVPLGRKAKMEMYLEDARTRSVGTREAKTKYARSESKQSRQTQN